jgi:hypothetical protein
LDFLLIFVIVYKSTFVFNDLDTVLLVLICCFGCFVLYYLHLQVMNILINCIFSSGIDGGAVSTEHEISVFLYVHGGSSDALDRDRPATGEVEPIHSKLQQDESGYPGARRAWL